jgi:hypothetical protein
VTPQPLSHLDIQATELQISTVCTSFFFAHVHVCLTFTYAAMPPKPTYRTKDPSWIVYRH